MVLKFEEQKQIAKMVRNMKKKKAKCLTVESYARYDMADEFCGETCMENIYSVQVDLYYDPEDILSIKGSDIGIYNEVLNLLDELGLQQSDHVPHTDIELDGTLKGYDEFTPKKRTRSRGRELTKEMIKEAGVSLKMSYDNPKQPIVLRTRNGVTKEIKPCPGVKEKKFGKPITYMYIGWYNKGKQFTTSFSRLVYAWFNGDIPEGNYDIDHIDNDTLNNFPENLRLVTHKENIQKRPNHGCNQYKNSRTMGIYKK